MFFNLIKRNSSRSRKDNSLFFSTLIISIVAFYLLLSLSTQDVMVFLRQMESDAVNRLMTLIPAFWGLTLIILFFLTYFASKYQFERRRHEFGVYLMHGMSRKKLFGMLMTEDLLSSFFALIIGLPVSVLLSELISLVTAKAVGLGIIGHKFSLSSFAIVGTLVGFLSIKILALLILSFKISRQEIGELLSQSVILPKKQKSNFIYAISSLLGTFLLIVAYYLAIKGYSWMDLRFMSITLLVGILGTILFFYGLRILIELIVKYKKTEKELHTFTFRQIQENVINKSTAMAISSLLILAALCCFGAGISISVSNDSTAEHAVDYTFNTVDESDLTHALPELSACLEENNLDEVFSDIFEIRIGSIRSTEDFNNAFHLDTDSKDIYYDSFPRLLCLSDYNHLLELAGKPTIELGPNEAAVYITTDINGSEAELNELITSNPGATLVDTPITLVGEVQTTNIVADRAITLSFALILPDDVFLYHTQGNYSKYMNAVLSEEATNNVGLMEAYTNINEKLNSTDLIYESFLQGIGRNLFYTVASSYITIYLALVFIVVANTIIGVQFLMNQQKTYRRYQTLIRLGATYDALTKSAEKQIIWFIGIPVLVAVFSSLFGIRALFTGLQRDSLPQLLSISAIIIILLSVVEFIYIRVIKHSSDKFLLSLMQFRREE